MDYSKLSDRDIDALVLQDIYGNQAKDKDIMRAWLRGGFKYTTNPADAWPIIVGSKINIRFGAEGMACEAQFIQYGHESVEFYHGNPLRAAMIVFLMMQDANHA